MLTLTDGRDKLYQWDTDVFATVDDESINEVHFSHLWYGENYNVEVKNGTVRVPDEVLQNGADIYVWAYIATENGGVTKRDCTLNVTKRPKPNDYVYTATERKNFESLQKQIGNLENLDTEAKNSLVEAINEAIASGGGADPDAIAKIVEEYLAENPPEIKEKDPTVSEWAKAEEKPTYTASEVGALSQSELQSGVDKALQQAKESGEFDGEDGYTPQKGIDYFDGEKGDDGKTPEKGVDYFTEADKQELVTDVLNALPEWQGGSY